MLEAAPADGAAGEGEEPTNEEQQALYEEFANRLSRCLLDRSKRRLGDERHREWRAAFAKSGPGSTVIRARILPEDVYEPAAPVPGPCHRRTRTRS